MSMRDHPDIERAMRTWHGLPQRGGVVCCPICGEELFLDDRLYRAMGMTVGCSNCVKWERVDEFLEAVAG